MTKLSVRCRVAVRTPSLIAQTLMKRLMISPLLLRTVLICRNCKLPLAPAPGKMFFRPTSTVSSVGLAFILPLSHSC